MCTLQEHIERERRERAAQDAEDIAAYDTAMTEPGPNETWPIKGDA